MREVLVVVDADPRASGRAVEALRMSVGLTLSDSRVRILLSGEAERLLRHEAGGFPDHLRAGEYLKTLATAGVEVGPGEDVLEAARVADVVLRWTDS